MSRYSFNIGKAINRLLPFYLRGKNIILYLTAILNPLQTLNRQFAIWAENVLIDLKMTSQVILFEWYLTKRLSQYFIDSTQRIVIQDSESIGVPLYWEDAEIEDDEEVVVGFENETISTNVVFYLNNEIPSFNNASFIVYSPAINSSIITNDRYKQLLIAYIEKYRLSGKTYIIKINK